LYPSLHNVQAFLPSGLMRMPEARDAWHDAFGTLDLTLRRVRVGHQVVSFWEGVCHCKFLY